MDINSRDLLVDIAVRALLALIPAAMVGIIVVGLLAGHSEPLIGTGVVLAMFGSVWGILSIIDR